MPFVSQGAAPSSEHYKIPASGKSGNKSIHFPRNYNLFFLFFLILFYVIELFFIRPADGINDDWGMYSTLSGAYLGYPDAHVLFFLYPLSWCLSQLYRLCSWIPWYGLFQHGIQILCLYTVYCRSMKLWKRHQDSDFQSSGIFAPALAFLLVLFFIVDLNVLSEAQYTTTAGVAAACALFCFITSRMNDSTGSFLLQNIPTFFFCFISFSLRQNMFYLMLPMAGMLWLAKWMIARKNECSAIALKLFGFVLILAAGMGILFGLHKLAYSQEPWNDFVKINHYRERIGDFYTWPEYDECSDKLEAIGVSEEAYYYRKNGAPYIGYGMSVDDWKQMHDIARECYLARTNTLDKFKNIITGSLTVFFYQDGMQPLSFCVALLLLLTFLLILFQHNSSALLVYLFYLFGRMVSWSYVLYEGRFPKRIAQPLLITDFLILFGILTGFHLLVITRNRQFAVLLPCLVLLSLFSLYSTKTDIDTSYHAHEATWNDLKAYCHAHPDNFYIWTYNTGTLDNYCESPFDTTLDTYNNFIYTNWGVVCNPNTNKKLADHGIADFGKDLVENDSVYFIFAKGLYNEEHPVIMYFRHTYNTGCSIVDSFTAGDTIYEVYQLGN